MSMIQELDAQWGECWLEPEPVPPELSALLKKAFSGTVPVWAPLLAPVPWVVRAMMGGMDKKVSHMPVDLWDLIAFVVSQDNACRYCYGATRTILGILGYSESAIDRLERDVELDAISPADQTALRFARKVSRANPLPDAAALRELRDAGFSGTAIAEIAFVSAFAGYGNRVATLFAIPPEQFENMLRNPLLRLIRPLIARQFRGRALPPAALPAPNEPPFEELIAALEGSPVAHTARTMIDDAMISRVLPYRTKMLIFGVIGRALGCAYVERQARRGLLSQGLTETDIDEILEHLGSTRLDSREQTLIPFVRETVRYRSLPIQHRTRELSVRMPLDELIEAVGVAALANSVARLSVLLDPC